MELTQSLTSNQHKPGPESAPEPESEHSGGTKAVVETPWRAPSLNLSDPDASIALLGLRGTGKTSLAVLAAGCTGFNLVDADQHFHQATGLTRALYASKHGFDEYRNRELSLMRTLLEQHPTRCIIVCGPGSSERTGQELLKHFRKNHPVIYIIRDAEDISRYLCTGDTGKISDLMRRVSPIYRPISNFEFYNLSEPLESRHNASFSSSSVQTQVHPSLVLKHVEQDFANLIHSIRSEQARPQIFQARHSLSHLSPESKPYTYALTVPIDRVTDIALQLRSTDLIVDAIELVVNLETLLSGAKSISDSMATFITKQYATLRRNVRLPVIFHVQLPPSDEHHLWSTYRHLLFHALRMAPEFLSVDLRLDNAMAQSVIERRGSTKIIGTYHCPDALSDGWDSPSRLQLLERAGKWGCDLIRLSQLARSPEDNLALQRFALSAEEVTSAHVPLILYNTGRMGRASCYSNSTLTPVTHDLVDSSQGLANEWMLTVQLAQSALYASFTLDAMVFGIFGTAVSEALSPKMHNAAFKFCGMPHQYHVYQVPLVQDIEPIVRDPSFGGASISAPFKKDIMSILDYVSPEAEAIGAVNTLIPLRSKNLTSLVDRNHAGPTMALFGDNTDWIGIHTCIRRNLSPINALKRRTTALILGAGGMAQAAIYAAIRLGVQNMFIFNRTLTNAQTLAAQFHGKSFSVHNIDLSRTSPTIPPSRSGAATPSDQKIGPVAVHTIESIDEPWPQGFDPPTIIVACISRIGVDGQPPPDILLPDAWLASPTGGVVVELAYNPTQTPLVKQVQSRSKSGWIAVHGLQVLPEQGFAQFELFTGRKAPEHIMRAQIADRLFP